MRKKIYPWLIGVIFGYMITLCLVAGCIGTETINETNQADGSPGSSTIKMVELYHFHGNHQCYSCVKLGEMAEEVVNTYYQDEIASGKLKFGHINAEDPVYADLAERYLVSSSSLMVGVYTADSFEKENLIEPWYRLRDPDRYTAYLRGILDPLLHGENS